MGTLGSQASWFNTAWMVSCWKDLIKIETSQVPGGLERIVSRSVDGIKRNNSTAVWTLEPWISVWISPGAQESQSSGKTEFGFVQIDAAIGLSDRPIWSPALGPLGPKTVSGEEPAEETEKPRDSREPATGVWCRASGERLSEGAQIAMCDY